MSDTLKLPYKMCHIWVIYVLKYIHYLHERQEKTRDKQIASETETEGGREGDRKTEKEREGDEGERNRYSDRQRDSEIERCI